MLISIDSQNRVSIPQPLAKEVGIDTSSTLYLYYDVEEDTGIRRILVSKQLSDKLKRISGEKRFDYRYRTCISKGILEMFWNPMLPAKQKKFLCYVINGQLYLEPTILSYNLKASL